MAFTSVDTAISQILRLGRNALLAKIDIEHAYRNVPVHIEDRPLLGMAWNGGVFINTVLPFGLRSAPKIFSALADALEWILLNRGVSFVIHYLDDFLTVGSPMIEQCKKNLELICAVCEELGIPLKLSKVEGPSTEIIFLGIVLNTVSLEIRLPVEKICHLKGLWATWKNKRSCTKRELLSLIGKLSHACKVVVAGRLFLRRMIDAAKKIRRLNHWVHLNAEFHSNLEWWSVFLDYWNGRSLMEVHTSVFKEDITIFTDASGNWGCGAAWKNEWIQYPWDHIWVDQNIATKELLPILFAVAVWGSQWRSKHLLVRCDNMAVVQILNAQNCKDQSLLYLMRCLHFFLALYDIRLRARHVEGTKNLIADAISRNLLQVLRQANPLARHEPMKIPPTILRLMAEKPDWRSDTWKRLLRSSLGTAWHLAPEELTQRLKPSS